MLTKVLCGASLLCVASLANAGVITQEFEVDRQRTNFTNTIEFALFNDMGGMLTLESVEFSLVARSSGTAQVENTNPLAAPITATLMNHILLRDLFDNILVEAAPTVSRIQTLAGFDGVIDFEGPSGVQFLNMTTNEFASTLITDLAMMMAYIGVGNTSVDFVATAASYISGGGNISSRFDDFSSGDLAVVYTFSETALSVPAPSNTAIFGLGLLGFAGMRRFIS